MIRMNNQKNLRERYMRGTYNGTPLKNSKKFIDAVSKKGIRLKI